MDKETAKYILDYFTNLLNDKEKLALKHWHANTKINSGNPNSEYILAKTNFYKKRNWLTEDKKALELLKDGYDNFELNVAQRILENHRDEISLNNCKKCGKLARTPQAKQCRFCGNDWH
ncbi:MAG: hypothetical protein IPG89_14095 [Bacteroidetes bacterium]|nr:hypothetical protein [Bacteroidota bacterium]